MKSSLSALSPLDGRYVEKTEFLQEYCSEYALMKYRVYVEISWLTYLKPETKKHLSFSFTEKDALEVKALEKKLNHDVKAVEVFIQQKIKDKALREWVHWGCTSDDINNLAYALMIKDVRVKLINQLDEILTVLQKSAHHYADVAMLARTHGQIATPTTVGKEFANFYTRLENQKVQLEALSIYGKINGAVGNFNAHVFVSPDKNWPKLAEEFVESLGLEYQAYTTQIEPHDYLAEIFHQIIRINNILIDLTRDMWGYISLDYFQQKAVKEEVGSSTMPHKINPIDFENAEGNLYLSNSILSCLADKLPLSRFQRDLVDSTLLRNIGVGIGYAVVAYASLLKGLNKIEINLEEINQELEGAWEVLAEPIQMFLRAEGIENAYDKLKALTRGKKMTKELLHKFIDGLDLSTDKKNKLKKLTPQAYVGLAAKLAKGI